MNKALEATKRLKWGLDITQEERINLCECIEKELKVLEIIKECEIIYAEYGNDNYIVVPKNKMDLLKEVML